MHANPARLRATSYVTRNLRGRDEVLVFDYDAQPALGTHLPGGGVDPGERPDTAAIREAIEEPALLGSSESSELLAYNKPATPTAILA